MKSDPRRFVAVVRFDSPTWPEFQKIIMGLLDAGLELKLTHEPMLDGKTILPEYAAWQLILTSKDKPGGGK